MAWSFQGQRGIWQPDEGYYVSVAMTMNQQNDYLIPRICDEVFLDKPPLLYWGILSGYKLWGHNEFALRFTTGLSFFLTCGLVFLLGYRIKSNYREGVWASIIYSTMALSFSAANFITMDTTLTLFTTLSMLAFWESVKTGAKYSTLWKLVVCIAVGLGFLTKGPAALIPTGAMFVYLLINRKVISYFRTPWALLGLVLFLLVGLSWYIYVSIQLPDAAKYFIDNQLYGRLVSDKYHRNPGLLGALIY